MASLRRARVLAGPRAPRQLALGARSSASSLKLGQFGAARALADSLLAAGPPAARRRPRRGSRRVAALTGRLAHAVALTRTAARAVHAASGGPDAALREAARRARDVRGARSGPARQRAGARARVERLITRRCRPRARERRAAHLGLAMSLAFPALGPRRSPARRRAGDYLLELQALAARGERGARARAVAGPHGVAARAARERRVARRGAARGVAARCRRRHGARRGRCSTPRSTGCRRSRR
jgi:hypothetical protein